jgi:hypothetical protein
MGLAWRAFILNTVKYDFLVDVDGGCGIGLFLQNFIHHKNIH